MDLWFYSPKIGSLTLHHSIGFRINFKTSCSQLRLTRVKQVRFSLDTKPTSRHPSIKNVPRLNVAPQPDPQPELQSDPEPQGLRRRPGPIRQSNRQSRYVDDYIL